MAKNKAKKEKQDGGGGGNYLLSLIAAVLLGAGGGAAFGFLAIPSPSQPDATHAEDTSPPPPAAPVAGRFPADAIELAIPSVITDLGTDPKVRARLDVSIIVAHGTPESTTLIGEVREDVIAYLKGLNVSDIEGVRGFQNLREQLDDRARIRGRGAVLGLLIGGLVFE
ncbi:MAG: flagellar basal body-associated FliL family protein [Hyphomicrobium sp.]|uniref:flagellar basal body-associated FliL family protein n=1 Tax=Hyphomicrobium sp. TaxID=82 RepID=UPI0039E2C12A